MLIDPSKAAAAANAPRSRAMREAHRHWQQGVGFSKAGKWLPAERAFAKAVDCNPLDSVYLLNLSRSQLTNQRLAEALRNAWAVLELTPDDTVARSIAAECMNRQHRYAEAVDCLRQQPPHLPRSTEYHQMLSMALFNAGRHQEAIVATFDALGGNMAHAMSHYRLGLSFNAMGLKAEATECLRTALLLGMGAGALATQSLLAFFEREMCRWAHAGEDLAAMRRLAAELPEAGGRWIPVFVHVTLTDDAAEHLRIARSSVRFTTHGTKPLLPVAPRALPERLRVGFVSADFHQHATTVLMAEVFEMLDRSRFDVSLYSHGPQEGDAMRERLKRAADHFIEASTMSDFEVALHIREAGIDVLVDLKGHTRDSRLGILAHRAAPVQASFLGFPGTTGADFIDYFIGDDIVSPLANEAHFCEKLALLPRCYQPNDRKRPLPVPLSRAAVGLSESALVLCGFNQPFKLSPEVLDVWCRLLHRLPDAVLWLLDWNSTAPGRLREEAAARGIDPSRLVFAPKVALGEHISRFALADLFLDTWPCNGHTTASDALWAGVPVITCTGETFASRVATSLLHAVGLSELACSTTADYERRVVELATNAPRRAALRERLIAARDNAPLFDSPGYARDFGDLLWAMAERWSQGLPPDHLCAPTRQPVEEPLS